MVVDAGDATRTYEMAASGAGRGVETPVRRGVVEVSEVTIRPSLKGMGGAPIGSVVRTARFMATRALARVGQPVPREDASERPLRDDPNVR